jgi:hypothetical protein
LVNDAFFLKYNIMKECPIPLGERINNDLVLHDVYDTNRVYDFMDLLSKEKKNIILVSSST